MGMKITGDRDPLGGAELANLLILSIDGERADRNPAPLKVIGIEDMIAEQVAFWTHRVPSAQAATRMRCWSLLRVAGSAAPSASPAPPGARHGRRGRARDNVAWGREAHDTAPRAMALSNMEAVSKTWGVASGFTFEQAPPHASRRPHER